jgi:hypothetical protein
MSPGKWIADSFWHVAFWTVLVGKSPSSPRLFYSSDFVDCCVWNPADLKMMFIRLAVLLHESTCLWTSANLFDHNLRNWFYLAIILQLFKPVTSINVSKVDKPPLTENTLNSPHPHHPFLQTSAEPSDQRIQITRSKELR